MRTVATAPSAGAAAAAAAIAARAVWPEPEPLGSGATVGKPSGRVPDGSRWLDLPSGRAPDGSRPSLRVRNYMAKLHVYDVVSRVMLLEVVLKHSSLVDTKLTATTPTPSPSIG